VEIEDTVANLEAAYTNGNLTAIQNEAAIFFGIAKPGATNLGLDVRVADTVDHINTMINSGSDANLASMASSFIVVDTAANIVASINKNNWQSATNIANNIVVKDTYANIKANASVLFNASQSNGDHVEVTKVIFTDIAGADVNSPLVVGTGYTANGQLPQFDFSQATGFAQTSGVSALTVTESVLTQSAVSSLASNTSSAGTNAHSGVALTIGDSVSSKVAINILSTSSTTGNPDTTNSAILSVIATPSSTLTLTKNYLLSAGNSGTPSATNSETILGISTGDKISFSTPMTTVTSPTASSGLAAVNGSTAVATFSATDTTSAQHITAVEKALNTTSANGHVALYTDNSAATVATTSVLVTDASHAAGANTASAGDNLVQVVGVAPSQVALSGGVLVVH
jgi:hypothetical protein